MAIDDEADRDPEDREARIDDLKRQAEELSGGHMTSFGSDDLPAEMQEEFWEQVVAFEQAELRPLFDRLVEGGVALPAPDQLDDVQLKSKLWEVIHALALLDTYLYSTDHLSDRELYHHLWNDSLREPTEVMPADLNYAYNIDMVGSGSEEDMWLYFKYYADEEDRRRWAESWPEFIMPDRETPPFDRDRHLPQWDPDAQPSKQ